MKSIDMECGTMYGQKNLEEKLGQQQLLERQDLKLGARARKSLVPLKKKKQDVSVSCPGTARRNNNCSLSESERMNENKQDMKGVRSDANKCLSVMESAIRRLDNKYKSYESGDYLMLEDEHEKNCSKDAFNSLDSYGQSIKLNSGKHQNNVRQKKDDNMILLFPNRKLTSEISILDSGYRTNSNNCSQSSDRQDIIEVTEERESTHLNDLKPCTSNTQLYYEDTVPLENEKVRDIFLNVLSGDSRFTKLINGSSQCLDVNGKPICILEEFKKCLNKEKFIENKIAKYLNEEMDSSKTPTLVDDKSKQYYYDLKNLDESLIYVKDNLASIKRDLSEFKENCWDKIESNVNEAEFTEAVITLKNRIVQLERKVLAEQRVLKQDIQLCNQKLASQQDSFAIRNFPVWPFVAFLGAYSIMYFGNKT